jgi:hypothetical protein
VVSGRRDVELKCDGCGRETLATDGCWDRNCWVCGGTRAVVVTHDHLLSCDEMRAAGYSIGSVGKPAPPKPTK